MKDIAAICNVSVATVSKALSNRPGVNADTSQRIQDVARKFNYRPNALVRSLQTGRSMSVAVACNAIEDPWAGLVMRGVLESLYKAGYDPLLLLWDLAVHSGEHLLRSMGERRVDGIIMFPPADPPSARYLQELRSFEVPVVLLDQRWPACDFHFAGTDDRIGVMAAVDHLVGLGHRAVGCLYCPHVSTGTVRRQAYMAAMARHALPISYYWQAPASTYDEALVAARDLLGRANGPTALVCFNDEVAWGTMVAAADLGLRVPTDLSVVGMANLPCGARLRPRLTTIEQPNVELGRRGVELLLASIDAGESAIPLEKPEEVLLPTHLIIRESTARCRAV